MILFIALFVVSHSALIYVSQYNYVSEIRQFYRNEINLYLKEGKKTANIVEESRVQQMTEEGESFIPESESELGIWKEKESDDMEGENLSH